MFAGSFWGLGRARRSRALVEGGKERLTKRKERMRKGTVGKSLGKDMLKVGGSGGEGQRW